MHANSSPGTAHGGGRTLLKRAASLLVVGLAAAIALQAPASAASAGSSAEQPAAPVCSVDRALDAQVDEVCSGQNPEPLPLELPEVPRTLLVNGWQ